MGKNILSNMNPRDAPSEQELTNIFKDCFKNTKVLKYDWHHWKRLETGNPDKTFRWLRARMEVHMREERHERNKTGHFNAHTNIAEGKRPDLMLLFLVTQQTRTRTKR